MSRKWVEPDTRDDVVSTVEDLHTRCAISRTQILGWASVRRSVYYDWRDRQGLGNRPGGVVLRSDRITEKERETVLDYARSRPGEGYRRLAYLMIDADLAALSPASVYRILKAGELLGRTPRPSAKGTGFKQPKSAHSHWHVDFTYLNLSGTFHFLCAILDGWSRAVVAWEIAPTMTAGDAEIVLQKAREAYPDARPRVISDNGRQFVGREFTTLLSIAGFSQVTTSPYYPQSNGKIERFNGSLKNECIYPTTPLTLEDARGVVGEYVDHYNHTRLHSATGYVAPTDMLAGKQQKIHKARDQKLAKARIARIKHNKKQTPETSSSLAA